MPGLPVVTPRQMVRVLAKLGFVERRQTGSHRIFRHSVTGKIVPVPMHRGDLKPGTLRSMLRQADLTVSRFLGLLRKS